MTKTSQKKPFYKRWLVWVGVIIAIFVIALILTPVPEETTPVNSDVVNKENKEKTEESVPSTPKEQIEKIIIDNIDEKTNMDNDRIVSIEDMSEGADWSYVLLTLNGSENFTNELTKSTLWSDSTEILEPISKMEGVQKIVLRWQLPLTDTNGNTSDVKVMTINLEREQLDKINWENFNGENYAKVSKDYFEHPVFKQ